MGSYVKYDSLPSLLCTLRAHKKEKKYIRGPPLMMSPKRSGLFGLHLHGRIRDFLASLALFWPINYDSFTVFIHLEEHIPFRVIHGVHNEIALSLL